MRQAIELINAGCDAIYIGLKKWSARNRASNVSVEEYGTLLTKCRQNNKKLYLAINTLLKDQEIHEIIELFRDDAVPLPDAIIVADLGLIVRLRQAFPTVKIHASTQFGAYTIADMQLLEELSVDRVILPRELRLSEINVCCENTKMEIEVFVFGSQCICFSGQCLLGGMIAGGSGNRGRCIGMCRDTYEDLKSKRIGQFLYPQDIHAFCQVGKLKKIGVSSLKIEGRMRNTCEIKEAISQCRQETKADRSCYCGFLSESSNDTNIICCVNPRVSYNLLPTDLLGEHDYIIDDNTLSFYDGNRRHSQAKFVKSLFTKPLSEKKPNISIKIIGKDKQISQIDYINEFGERTVFELSPLDSHLMTIEQLCNHISYRVNANLYELSSNLPSQSTIAINAIDLQKAIECINKSLQTYSKPSTVVDEKQSYVLQTSIASKAIYHLSHANNKVIFNMYCLDEVQQVLKYEYLLDRIVFRIPLFEFTEQFLEMLLLVQNKQVMITKVSQLLYASKYSFQSIIADYTVNCWNKETLSYLIRKGVSGIVLNPELSLEDNLDIVRDSGLKIYCIKYGKLTLGYSRICFNQSNLCTCDIPEKQINLANSLKGFHLEIICHRDLDMREIKNGKQSFCPYNQKDIEWICIEDLPPNKMTDYSLVYNRSVK